MNSKSIKTKIWLGVLMILIGYVASMVTFHSCSKMIFKQMTVTADARFPASKLSQKVLNGFQNYVKLFNDSVLMGDTGKIDEAKEMSKACAADLEKIMKLVDTQTADFAGLNDLSTEMSGYVEEAVKVYTQMAEGENNDALIKQAAALATRKTTIQEKLDKLEAATSHELLSQLQDICIYLDDKTRLNFTLFAVMFIVCVLLVHFIIKNHVVRPLNEITAAAVEMEKGNFGVQVTYRSADEIGTLADAFRSMADSQMKKAVLAEAIAKGDLTCTVKLASDQDVLGKALSDMIDSLNKIIRTINETSGQVVIKAEQMAAASQSLSDGAMQTASSLEEISSSISEIEAQTRNTAQNAAIANQLADGARVAAELGNTNMAELVKSISEIQDSSRQVVKVIKVIDDIAFQTNLLALNAAVEAARAGRHGKGFAVVADEVRNLASRSAKAAQETAEMINTTSTNIQAGSLIATKTDASLKEIVNTAVKMVNLISEISSASAGQANSIALITQGLTQIDSVTQHNAGNAEETASVSEELSQQAFDLQAQLKKFKLKN